MAACARMNNGFGSALPGVAEVPSTIEPGIGSATTRTVPIRREVGVGANDELRIVEPLQPESMVRWAWRDSETSCVVVSMRRVGNSEHSSWSSSDRRNQRRGADC